MLDALVPPRRRAMRLFARRLFPTDSDSIRNPARAHPQVAVAPRRIASSVTRPVCRVAKLAAATLIAVLARLCAKLSQTCVPNSAERWVGRLDIVRSLQHLIEERHKPRTAPWPDGLTVRMAQLRRGDRHGEQGPLRRQHPERLRPRPALLGSAIAGMQLPPRARPVAPAPTPRLGRHASYWPGSAEWVRTRARSTCSTASHPLSHAQRAQLTRSSRRSRASLGPSSAPP